MKSILLFGFSLGLAWAAPVKDNQIYTFGVGTDWKPYEFIDEDGNQMGFSIDIIRRVCEHAQKRCAFVSYSSNKMCWNAKTMSSEALNSRYFDVCSNMIKTTDSALVYSFVGEYAQETPSYLYVRADNPMKDYDPQRYALGFVDGSAQNPACIKRFMHSAPTNPTAYNTVELAMQALQERKIQVVFMPANVAKGFENVRPVGENIKCAEKGLGLMVRKDMVDKYAWFDNTLKGVIESDYYPWACNIAKMAYGGDPNCLDH